jgi:hypothetical protein
MIIVLALVAPVLGTNRWFADTETRSSNGRFHATAKSPDNRKRNPPPFQGDFVFTLRDTVAKRTLWQFKQPDHEAGGTLYVSDSGDVIRRGVVDTLWLIRPTDEQIKLGNAQEEIPRREVDHYCQWSTAGLFWSQFSWIGFHPVDGQEFFYIRTYWGRTIAVDLARGRFTSAKSVRESIEAAVLARANVALQTPADQLWTKCESCGGKHLNPELKRSVLVLEQHKAVGRERILKALEGVEDHHIDKIDDALAAVRKHGFVNE